MIITDNATIHSMIEDWRMEGITIEPEDINLISLKRFVFNDGGKYESGLPLVRARDCLCRAISIAADLPYAVVFEQLAKANLKHKGRFTANEGIVPEHIFSYLFKVGFEFVDFNIPLQPKRYLKDLPGGRMVVLMKMPSGGNHAVALIDNVIHDLGPRGMSKGIVLGMFILNKKSQ